MFHILVFILFLSTYSYAQVVETPNGTQVNVNVYASPVSTASNAIQSDILSTQLQTTHQEATFIQQITSYVNFTPIKDALDEVPSIWEHIKQECIAHTWSLMGGTALMAYLYTCALLVQDNIYLNADTLWARWKFDQTLTSLCIINQEALRKELIIAIQQRYIDPQNPTECIKPLTRFIDAIEKEKKRLETYCSRASWLKTLRLSKIMPINDDKIAQAHILLERLQFVNSIFLAWASEYNWGHFN